jgi:Tol biopolymer transport system component
MKIVRRILFLFPFFLFTSCAAYLKIGNTKQVLPKVKGDYTIAGMCPDGKSMLVTKSLYTGLYLINLESGHFRTLTNLPGAGYQPVFSKDGESLVFRADDFSQKKRTSSIYILRLKSGDTTVLVRRERVVSPPVVVGNKIAYTVNERLKTNGFRWSPLGHSIEKTFVLLEDLQPVLWSDDVKRVYKPSGEGRYIWVSLSPDGRKMVYHLAGKGTFVSDLYGRILLSAEDLVNPKWLNNNYIIGIKPRGYGSGYPTTDVVAFCVKTGKKTIITNTANVNERNPHPFDHGRSIAYQTSTGSLHVIKLKQ